MTDPAGDRLIKVVSSDEKLFMIPRKICAMSKTLDSILKDLGLDDQETITDAIPVSNVKAYILKKVISWCHQHVDDPAPVSKKMKDFVLTEWDEEFFKVDQPMLMDIIKAANYLHIEQLLNGGCRTVANMIRGKSVEEIRNHFGIVSDFTPAEEEELRMEIEAAEE